MKKSNTREKIIDAMYKLIATEGYEKASIGKITKEVGISKPAVYHYFNSKEEILLEIAKNIYGNNCDFTLNELMASECLEEYKGRLYDIGARNINLWKKNIDLIKVVAEIDLQIPRIPQLSKIYVEYDNFLFNMYSNILQKGVSLKLFEDSFDIIINAQNLHIIHLGLITATLYSVNINTQSVWKLNVDNLPFKKGGRI